MLVVIVCTLLSWPLSYYLAETNLVMVYLLGVLAVAAWLAAAAFARRGRPGLARIDRFFEREIAATARQLGREPKEVAKLLERSGQIATLAGDIIRSKALDFLVEHADISPDPGAEEPTQRSEGSSEEAAATDATAEETS